MNVLSRTTKLPCPSFALPARASCAGLREAERIISRGEAGDGGSICGRCYAFRLASFRPRLREVEFQRFAWYKRALARGSAAQELVDSIKATGANIFRLFSSGDFHSIKSIETWIKVAKALPGVRFYAPTRTYVLKAFLPALRRLHALPNVSVRPSALTVDQEAPIIKGLGDGTRVVRRGHTCPATDQNNECGECRLCFDKTGVIAYKAH